MPDRKAGKGAHFKVKFKFLKVNSFANEKQEINQPYQYFIRRDYSFDKYTFSVWEFNHYWWNNAHISKSKQQINEKW